eukprot:CAMPEP_0170314050 /NCGR_PEP_ID=MMETSP0116_2-20130129/57592_1 /TAXON_ID=400756 /ORGANISM="Durinskia baltica, Strain CSIRO CS-38" /LENGTH=97 /DNA_ID=CAMNT_0010566487 /DNA_START=174 /DNA_END=467 /DNA_ORIENTATION=-
MGEGAEFALRAPSRAKKSIAQLCAEEVRLLPEGGLAVCKCAFFPAVAPTVGKELAESCFLQRRRIPRCEELNSSLTGGGCAHNRASSRCGAEWTTAP